MIKDVKLLYLFKGSFASHVLTLMTGTIIAQLISIAISPILTRMYSPLDYGLFAIYVSLGSITSVVATGRYELSVMLPPKDEDAVNIVALSFVITFTVSVLTLLCVWAFNHEISRMLESEAISNWLYLIPVTVLLTGIYQTLNYWSNRKKQYMRVAISRISMSITTAGVFLGMGFARMGASGFLVGSILGQSVATGLLGWQGWKEDKKYRKFIRKMEIIQHFKKYKDFLIFNSPTALLNSISQSLPIFIMSSSFDSSTVGLYSLSVRVIYWPLNLISSSVEQVFQKVAEKYRDGEPLKPQLFKIALTFALIYFFPVIILTLFGIDLFAFVFGEQWREAGKFSQILVIPFAFKSVISPLTMAIPAAGKIKLGSIWHVLYFVTISTTLFLASKLRIESFLLIFALHELVLYTIYLCLTLVAIRPK